VERWVLCGVLLGLFLLFMSMVTPPAECSACIGQYCAFDEDCPQECACAKPPWEVDGACW
jgi:hypothetical protein